MSATTPTGRTRRAASTSQTKESMADLLAKTKARNIRMQRNRSRTALAMSWIFCLVLAFTGHLVLGTLWALFAGMCWVMANERIDAQEFGDTA